MRILFLDTETTGLPKNQYSNALESPGNWPDIVSVSWSVYNNRQHEFIRYFIIKPHDWIIPQESTNIHGITHEYANEHGASLGYVLEELSKDLSESDIVVAHNMQFDKNVLFASYKWRLNMNPWHFWPKDEICTMLLSENELKLPSKFPKPTKLYKSPSLKELYEKTFMEKMPQGAHNSKQDVECLSAIYWMRWPDECV